MDLLNGQANRRRRFTKSNKTGYRGPARQPEAIGFLKDEISGKDQFHFLNFSKFAEHIVWRVAHFIDDAKLGRGRSFEDFKEYLRQTEMQVAVQDVKEADRSTRKALLFTDIGGFGFSLKDSQICDQLRLENLAKHITDIEESGAMASFSRVSPIPEKEDPAQPTWFYAPSPAERGKHDKVIVAAMSDAGIYGTFKPAGLGDADPYQSPLGMKMVARVKRDGSFVDEPYSKTMTPITGSSNMFSVESNSSASMMKYQTIAGRSLEDFLSKIYDDGCYTIHGKAVFADRSFYGRRIKKSKITQVKKSGGDAYRKFLPGGGDDAFLNNYLPKKYGDQALRHKYLLKDATFKVMEMGNILPQQRTVFAIDIDNLEVPEDRRGEIDFINNPQESIEWLRERLPEAMQDTKLVLMLSSSYGMAKDEGTVTFLGKAGSSVSLRVWLQADKPIDATEFEHLIRHNIGEMAADKALYSHNQPIYGAPKFNGCEDPIKEKRTIIVPGTETFDVDMLAEEAEALDEVQAAKMPLSARARVSGGPGSQTGARRAVKVIPVNPEDSLIDQSRARTLGKLQKLGDRQLMDDYTGADNHFHAVRRIANAHFNVLFDISPALIAGERLSQADLFENGRNDDVVEELSFLRESVIDAFCEAQDRPDRITSASDLHRYGVNEQGLVPGGTIATLLVDSGNFIAQSKRADYDNTVKAIADAAKENRPLDQKTANRYLEKYTMPTGVNKSPFALRADAVEKYCVLVNPEGLFVDFRGTNDMSSKIATYSGEDRYFWAPVVSNDKIPHTWQEGRLREVFDKLADLQAPQNMVFCHNCKLDDIKHLLPKPTGRPPEPPRRPKPTIRPRPRLGPRGPKPTGPSL